jgi:DNA-directed RNA polymerase specialized sigma24 family protein
MQRISELLSWNTNGTNTRICFSMHSTSVRRLLRQPRSTEPLNYLSSEADMARRKILDHLRKSRRELDAATDLILPERDDEETERELAEARQRVSALTMRVDAIERRRRMA